MLSSRSRPILAAAVCLLAVACSNDSPTDPPDPSSNEGVVRFSYSAPGLDGAFAAQGALATAPGSDPGAATFAVGFDLGGEMGVPFYEVVAFQVGSATLDAVGILLSAQKTGTYAVVTEDACVGPSSDTPCALSWFFLNYDPEDYYGTKPIEEYVLTSGSVTVTSISNGRLKGTFQGTARKLMDGAGSTGPFVQDVSVEVAGGTFDVPVMRDQGWMMLPSIAPAGGATLSRARADGPAARSTWSGARGALLRR